VDRVRVSSTSVVSVGYDSERAELEIEFVGGGVYRYLDVPPETAIELLRAESIGRFVNSRVKPVHACMRVG
jgi:hypothetical protein